MVSFPVGLPVKILKALLPSSILATCPTHLNQYIGIDTNEQLGFCDETGV